MGLGGQPRKPSGPPVSRASAEVLRSPHPTPFPLNKPAGSAPLSTLEATSQGLVLRGVQLTRRDLKKPSDLVTGWVLAHVGSCLWCEEPASRQRGEGAGVSSHRGPGRPGLSRL